MYYVYVYADEYSTNKFPSGAVVAAAAVAVTDHPMTVFGRRISRLINCQQGFLISNRDFRINHPARIPSRGIEERWGGE
jgi:hypothetical protein